jgi:transmembrane sensor
VRAMGASNVSSGHSRTIAPRGTLAGMQGSAPTRCRGRMTDHEHSLAADGGPDWTRLAREMADGDWLPLARVPSDQPRHTALLSALVAALHVPDPPSPTHDEIEGALGAVLARGRESATETRPSHVPATVPGRARRWTAWSAAAAVVVGAGALVLSRRGETPAITPRVQTITTAVGQVDSLRLPDGSIVILGPASSLARDARFGATARDVVLHGDAYFDVAHDAAHPFTVRTSRGVVRDVGTTFVVRSDAPTGLIVSVTAGVVALRRAGSDTAAETRLAAGDRATMPAHGALRVERGVGLTSDASFTRGRLVLVNATVGEIADAMRRWYGIDFRVMDAGLLGRRVTVTFDRENGPDAARILSAAMGGSARIVGDTVLVSSATAGSPAR